jgi:hypothetical protein
MGGVSVASKTLVIQKHTSCEPSKLIRTARGVALFTRPDMTT